MFRKFPIVCLILLPDVLPAQRAPEIRDVPDLWVVDYPSVEKVAPPTKSAFFDAANTILNVAHGPIGQRSMVVLEELHRGVAIELCTLARMLAFIE
jgi:hypothetical protein